MIELRIAAHIAVHSTFKTADHMTPVIKDCFADSALATNMSLCRTKCAALITKVLGPTFKEALLADMTGSKYSLIIDESTDVSSTKELAVVSRYFSYGRSKFCTSFLGLIPVYDASATGIFSSLKAFLDSCNISLEDCVGVGTDGASVMCGQNNSVFTHMKAENENMILVKCVCHSLQLACSEAVAVLPSQLDFLVRESFNWFSHSPKRQQTYHAIYAAINEGSAPHKLIGMSATRWLSIAGALRTILTQWLELKTFFNAAKAEERCYTARLLSDMYNDEVNLLFIKFVSPIVDEFERINKAFEAENPDPCRLHEDLLLFITSLMRRVVMPSFASPGSNWESHILHVRACAFGTTFRQALETANLDDDERTRVMERCRQFLVAAIKAVLKRVPSNIDLMENMKLLHCDAIATRRFGDIFEAFRKFIAPGDVSVMESEFLLLQANINELRRGSTCDFWINVACATNSAGEKKFPRLSHLALSLLTLPLSNASVERVFSQVALTKTDIRNRMSHNTLENTLHVKFALRKDGGCCKDFVPSDEFLRKFTSEIMYE
ncbi:uncharacterized protein LOC135400538 [Ornithodoros turicata]|uniref:uncharacterized protein LOC135400538 n=1 Tax=Ornithodoros turicata TaxID=34597 RepID=UPI003138DB7B